VEEETDIVGADNSGEFDDGGTGEVEEDEEEEFKESGVRI